MASAGTVGNEANPTILELPAGCRAQLLSVALGRVNHLIVIEVSWTGMKCVNLGRCGRTELSNCPCPFPRLRPARSGGAALILTVDQAFPSWEMDPRPFRTGYLACGAFPNQQV